jgi:hypothetical protein
VSTLETPTVDQFEAVLESPFALDLGEAGTLALTLTSLERLGGDPVPAPAEGTDAPRQPFSLVFRGPLKTQLGQGTYALRHDALGVLAIFLVPIARDADAMRYEAVFA